MNFIGSLPESSTRGLLVGKLLVGGLAVASNTLSAPLARGVAIILIVIIAIILIIILIAIIINRIALITINIIVILTINRIAIITINRTRFQLRWPEV